MGKLLQTKLTCKLYIYIIGVSTSKLITNYYLFHFFPKYQLRSCGHTVQVPCHMSPENVVCSGNCLKTLECGHECTKLCHEACGPCPTLVEKKIRECGHYIQVPCYDSHSELNRAQCYNMCTLILKCGHQCKQPCKNIYCDLFNPCEESVPAVGTCGHVIARQCYEEKTGSSIETLNFIVCG